MLQASNTEGVTGLVQASNTEGVTGSVQAFRLRSDSFEQSSSVTPSVLGVQTKEQKDKSHSVCTTFECVNKELQARSLVP